MSRPASSPRFSQPSRNTLRVAILAVLSTAPVLQAATIPPGTALDASEFLVNSGFTVGAQSNAQVARDAAGDFVVVWDSFDQASSTSSADIYAQRYNAAGQPQGSAFLVNTFTTNSQSSPAVAMDAAGDFVVAWDSSLQASSTSNSDVYARQYNAAGTALQASEFLVNTITGSGQRHVSSVAIDAAGDFVVAWTSYDLVHNGSLYYYDHNVYARQYNAAGTALQTSEFLLSATTSDIQRRPTVAMDAAGDFVAAWADYPPSSTHIDVYARQFDAAGSPVQASEFLVDTFATVSPTGSPSIAMDAAGDFALAWDSYQGGIYARQYTAAGTALQASEFLVNTFTSGAQFSPSVAMDAAGDFAVVWENEYPVGARAVYARQYDAAGTPLQASQFMVNTFSLSKPFNPSAAVDAAGDFVVVWESFDQASSTSGYDVYARRYQGPESVNLAATLGASPGSVPPGGATTLTLGVNNNTPATSYSNSDINAALGVATGISAVFTLPAGVTAGTVGGTGWSCGSQSGTSLTCSYSGSLAAASASPTLTVALTASTPSTQPVQVDVTSTQQDSDSSDNTASAALTVNDTVPTATSGHFTTNAGAGINGTLVATPGYTGQVLSYSVTAGPAHGGMSLNSTTGAFTYSPVRGFVGSDSFTFTAGDGLVTSSAATVSITVKDVAPMAVSGGAVTTTGTEVTKILVANPGYVGQPLSYSIVAQPAHGSVNLTASSGIFTYTPASGFSGADSFKFAVSDGILTSNSATESITVNAANNGGGGSTGGGSSGGGGGGSFGLLSLAFLGLPLFRRRRRYER